MTRIPAAAILPPPIELYTTAEGCAVSRDAGGVFECVTLESAINLRTRQVCGPYRGREAWIAWDDDRGDEPGSAMGHGDSEESAIADLLDQLAGV